MEEPVHIEGMDEIAGVSTDSASESPLTPPQTVAAEGGQKIGDQFVSKIEPKLLANEPLDWSVVINGANPPTKERLEELSTGVREMIKIARHFPSTDLDNREIYFDGMAQHALLVATESMAKFLGFKNRADMLAQNPPTPTDTGSAVETTIETPKQ